MRALALALTIALAGCGERVDADMARICRMTLPVLNPEGARIDVTRVSPGPGPRTVRIDYTAGSPQAGAASQGPRRRFVACAFSPVPPTRDEPDLLAIDTDEGPVAGASVYLMKRYWLATPDAVEADPGR